MVKFPMCHQSPWFHPWALDNCNHMARMGEEAQRPKTEWGELVYCQSYFSLNQYSKKEC